MKRSLPILFLLASLTLHAQTDWMSLLTDDMPAWRVSIPGTHDSGTAGVRFPTRHYARTQTMTLAEQWNAGIRFFDLRPRPNGNRLLIYHGPANCHLTFTEALNTIIEKLKANPSEFCIVMTNLAGGDSGTMELVDSEIRNTVPTEMLAALEPDMRVGTLRGRILFIHRSGKATGTIKAGDWIVDSSTNYRIPLYWQDYFCGSNNYLEHKWYLMETALEFFATISYDSWCINHASGYTGNGISTNIKRNASTTNARLLNYLQSNPTPTGIIPMDFPSQELISAIIACNFPSL